MMARIISNNDLILDNLTTPEEDIVIERFTVIDKSTFINPDAGGYNGVFKRYNRQTRRLARPFLGELRALCTANGIPLVVKDERPPWKYIVAAQEDITPDYLAGITLDDYQINSIKVGCRVEVCIFDIPTGGGKTEVMAGLCKAIKCPTVILADQRIVIDQIKQRLELREIIDEVGLFYAGQTPDKQLIIAGSVQSLHIPNRVPPPPQESDAYSKAKVLVAKDPEKFGLEANSDTGAFERAVNKLADKIHIGDNKKHASALKGFRKRRKRAKQFQAIVKKCEMIIVDECDLAGNNTQYKQVFKHYFTGRRRYGFSGTPFDPEKPVDGLFVQEHLGSVMMKVERRELEAKGRIVPIEYIMFALGNTPMERSAFDIAVRERMVENVEFHTIIKLICQQYKEERSLVLVERDPLGKALEAAIPGSVFIHGKTPKRRRNEVLRAFEKGDIRVVIGGKILRRGLDLKGGCENLILATGGKLWSTINQQIGRAVRINKRGFGRVIDFLLLYNKYLYRHSRARLRAVVDMGYKTKVVFPDGNKVEGGNFLVTGYRQTRPRTQIGQAIGPRRNRITREATQPDDSF